MPHVPQIVVPQWQELPSGLLVPSSVAERIESEHDRGAEVPAELRGQPAPIAIVDSMPLSADQMAGALNEQELGLDVSTLDELVVLVSALPFEHAFLLLARLAAALWHVRDDAAAQVELVRRFEWPEMADAVATSVAAHEARSGHLVVFAEQYVVALARLLVEHARSLALDHEPTVLEMHGVVRAYFAAATVVSAADADLYDGEPSPERWLVYLLKNGLYNARPAVLSSFTRARELFAVLPPELAEHQDYCPVDEWFAADYLLSAAEQQTAGFAAYALSRAMEEEAGIGDRSLTAPPAWRGDLEEKSDVIRDLLSAERDWYREQFAGLGDDLDAVAWERRPFLRRPFLRLGDGQWLLIAPRMIESWLGEGFLHRALESAQRRNESLRFSRFFGALVERYCHDLTKSVYPGDRPAGGGRVYGEQTYSRDIKKTSDVILDLGLDLVLIEVVSARVTAQMQVFGDSELLEQNLERMLFKKMRQLGRVSSDVLSGEAKIPDVDVAQIERVWPVLVTAGELMQTEMLWDQIDARLPDGLQEARLESLTVLDIGDFELLLGLVEGGRHLPDVLRAKNEGPYRRLEISRLITDELHLPLTVRPQALEERWQALTEGMRAVLRFDEEPQTMAS